MQTFIDEDELRMTRILLSNTTIVVQTDGITSESFQSNIGSPQGDSLSGTLFNIKFETSLRKIRAQLNEKDPTIHI